ncbi:MAG: alpha-amylase [Bacteroidetes bacterium]|nr:alpha-amylase [Bacteroidota bacterium]
MKDNRETLAKYWEEIYGNQDIELLNSFFLEIDALKKEINNKATESDWYKDAVVYSIYVDLFSNDFKGLEGKLDYIHNLGVNCIWLLPILDSPMRDAGFDISNYKKIREDLTGLEKNSSEDEQLNVFKSFLQKARQKGIRVIFDVAINHTSNRHYWFQESKKSTNNPYRDYYIWNNDNDKYKDARLLFKGMCPSNWEKNGDSYFFHRFFEFQPDLNYRNPKVLLEMSRNLIFWLKNGVDGFRADAIPFLWKEEGTNCENLPKTHTIVKFFRAVLDHLKPGTLLLAEACQNPYEVVKYFGDSDECHAGYHFPLMPQMFKAIAQQSSEPIKQTLSTKVTPEIPEGSQWFTFLRCHDELSLELVYVAEKDRKYIHENYCHDKKWDFRIGEGISARLSELMNKNPEKIGLAYSVMLTLPGTPVIYYGDEFGKANDEKYYQEQIKLTGKNDTRFLVRGRINWDELEQKLNNKNSFESKVYQQITTQVKVRTEHKNFGRGNLEWLNSVDEQKEVLAFKRTYKGISILVINNLSNKDISIDLSKIKLTWNQKDLLGNELPTDKNGSLLLGSYKYYWIQLI